MNTVRQEDLVKTVEEAHFVNMGSTSILAEIVGRRPSVCTVERSIDVKIVEEEATVSMEKRRGRARIAEGRVFVSIRSGNRSAKSAAARGYVYMVDKNGPVENVAEIFLSAWKAKKWL